MVGGIAFRAVWLASKVSRYLSILSVVLPFWYRLTQVVPDKGPLNGCVCVLPLTCVYPFSTLLTLTLSMLLGCSGWGCSAGGAAFIARLCPSAGRLPHWHLYWLDSTLLRHIRPSHSVPTHRILPNIRPLTDCFHDLEPVSCVQVRAKNGGWTWTVGQIGTSWMPAQLIITVCNNRHFKN